MCNAFSLQPKKRSPALLVRVQVQVQVKYTSMSTSISTSTSVCTNKNTDWIAEVPPAEYLLKAFWGGQHRRPSICASAHRCRVTGDAICKRSEFWGLGVEFRNLRAEFWNFRVGFWGIRAGFWGRSVGFDFCFGTQVQGDRRCNFQNHASHRGQGMHFAKKTQV